MDVAPREPPPTFSPAQQALWWLKKGALRLGPEWDKAHDICQGAEGSPPCDWTHALCHLIEGDMGNAGYWFHRTRKPVASDAAALWQEIVSSL
ncbi:hypothetical protein DIPPA_35019 [Diplonema papillatum]|nr:hypothetical protein DIPPA_35019 [Diplonema papillatum]